MFGHLVELDQLLQLVAKGHRMSGLSILRPEDLLRRDPLLGPIESGSIGHAAEKIYERSWRTPNSGKHGFPRPQPNYEAPHGMFGHLVELDQLLQLVAKGHRMSGLSILRPEDLLRRDPLLGPIESGSIGHAAEKIYERSWRTPNSGK